MNAKRTGKCWCGCGEDTDTFFAPGHDRRAERALLRLEYGGGHTAKWIANLGYSPDNSVVEASEGQREDSMRNATTKVRFSYSLEKGKLRMIDKHESGNKVILVYNEISGLDYLSPDVDAFHLETLKVLQTVASDAFKAAKEKSAGT